MTGALLIENFHAIAEAPNAVDRLHDLILGLAIRGKLVSQDPRDESSSVFLEKVRVRKQELRQVGITRPEEELAPIDTGTMGFELPQGWTWERLGNVTLVIMGQSPESTSYNSQKVGLPFYQGKSDFGALYPTPRMWCEEPKKIAEKDDVLISVRAPVGPTNLCQERSCIGRGLAAIRPLAGMNPFYLLYGLRAFEPTISSKGVGTTFQAIGKDDLRSFPFPIPPLQEQDRIVARINDLLLHVRDLKHFQREKQRIRGTFNASALTHLVDAREPKTFAMHWKRIHDNFDLLYDTPETVAELRKAILQLAVQGKLVPQDPNDEPASVLLEKIKADKEKLVAEKKIRKSDPLPPIKPEEIPHEMPKGWKWVRLKEVTDPMFSISYGVLVPGSDTSDGIPFVRLQDLDVKNPPTKPNKSIAPEIEARYARTRLNGGEILLGVVGSMGKLGVAPESWKGANIARAVCRIVPNAILAKDYLVCCLANNLIIFESAKASDSALNVGLARCTYSRNF